MTDEHPGLACDVRQQRDLVEGEPASANFLSRSGSGGTMDRST
ncbi:MAG TPA: hypothetical protein VFE92_11795 [Dermatophilaceae bacterium]|nr:hypothetical protein [Dermatophilaceae bacterium]